MNDRPINLRAAMRNATIDELDQAADEIGRHAIAVALAEPEPERPEGDGSFPPAALREDPEQRQRDLDSALADSIEIASRHRSRLGRRVCTRSDGEIVRTIFEALRRMQTETSDLGFPT